jgi:N-acetylmuramoyl-L-alanine amidase
MPTSGMSAPLGVTIHNTGSINVASNTTPAEQYTRATINNNMGSVRVHFYVDDTCAWQNLPLTLSGWHAADGNGNGNRKTISFEVIGNSAKAEANAVKLAAYFLKKYNKTVDNGLFTHTHWLNVRDGIKGDIDYLNTRKHPYKWCPVYILPHWSTFKNNVKNELAKLNGEKPEDSKPTDNKPADNKPA